MDARSRFQWQPDTHGYYTRQIGWKHAASGKRTQHKFLLGTDRVQAELKERKLREIWTQVAQSAGGREPSWPSEALEIAKAVAKWNDEYTVDRTPGENTLR